MEFKTPVCARCGKRLRRSKQKFCKFCEEYMNNEKIIMVNPYGLRNPLIKWINKKHG